MIEIDFYHIDAFEVSVFLPIYYALESIGIKPRPVLPNNAISTASVGYLDIDQCIKFYNRNKIKYYTTPNYNNPVCTTQGTEFLSLYKNLRIRIPYGPNIYPYGWGLSRKSTIGFDHILVHGEYYRKHLSSFIDINKIHVSGYPRYDAYFSRKSNGEINREDSSFDIDVKIKTILMLPTWGDNSSLNSLLELSIKLQGRFNVLLKPHHLSVVRDANVLESFEEKGCVVLRGNNILVEALRVSDVVICDVRSCAFGESILTNKKTIGLASNEGDCQWVTQEKLDEISYIVYDTNDVVDCVEKYIKQDDFVNSRSLWIQDRVEFSDGTSSAMTAEILNQCVKTFHIPLFKKILRKTFAFIFLKGWANQRLSTKIVSRLHLLITKCLGNYK